MSATNRGAVRKASDFYPTPGWCVDLILDEFADLGQECEWRWVFGEPCRGNGAIHDRMVARWPNGVFKWAEISAGRDFFNQRMRADCHITNPPFSLAEQFLLKSLNEASTVVYLLRLNFLGSQRRRPLFEQYPPSHLFVLSKRPSFTGKGTDATEYAWFVWDRRGFMRRDPGIYVL